MDGWIEGWLDRRVCGRMGGCLDGWMPGWVYAWMCQISCGCIICVLRRHHVDGGCALMGYTANTTSLLTLISTLHNYNTLLTRLTNKALSKHSFIIVCTQLAFDIRGIPSIGSGH